MENEIFPIAEGGGSVSFKFDSNQVTGAILLSKTRYEKSIGHCHNEKLNPNPGKTVGVTKGLFHIKISLNIYKHKWCIGVNE